ncbi:MAG: hypothetical protein AAF638_12355 [Pseudomonadota bacterium]
MALVFRPRCDAFAEIPALAHMVHDWQRDVFHRDPEDTYAQGDEVWLDLDAPAAVAITSQQAEELNREEAEYLARLRDRFDPPPPDYPDKATLIAELDAPSMAAFVDAIGRAMAALSAAMSWGNLTVLPMSRAPILIQENDAPQVAAAEVALLDMGLTRDFEGAMDAPAEKMAGAFGPLFWIARCNASAPSIALGAAGSSIAGMLCKYGNIHFYVCDPADMPGFVQALAACGFLVPEDGLCRERFSETGVIDNRQIIL